MAWWRQAIIWTNVDLSSGHSPESNFIGITEDVFIWYEFANYHFKITTTSPRGQWVKSVTRVFTFMGSSVNSENIECKNQVSWSYRMLGTASTGISTGQKKVWGLKFFLTLCIMRHWLFCWFSDWLISLLTRYALLAHMWPMGISTSFHTPLTVSLHRQEHSPPSYSLEWLWCYSYFNTLILMKTSNNQL